MNLRIAVLAAALTPAAAGGQQVVEIDFAEGRDVIDDELRAIQLSPIAIDHGRGALYVRDLAEPNGIMVFSLETGDWLRTYLIPPGEGPGEGEISRFALASEGGLYVLSHTRVIQVDSAGGFVSSWSAWGSRPPALCEFGGRPTIVVQGGLKRRATEGGADIVGARRPVREFWARRQGNREDLAEIGRWRGARVACTDDSAFLVLPSRQVVESGADGRRVVTLYAEARSVSLNPLRHLSGPSCPGMLTSVAGSQASKPYGRPGSVRLPVLVGDRLEGNRPRPVEAVLR